MSANVAFSLCAAVGSLLVVVLAGLKGDWYVVLVYALLVAGFLARAALGRPRREREEVAPERRQDSRLRGARFRRR